MTDLRLTIQKKPYCLANSRTVRGTLMDFGFEKRIVQVMVNLYDCGIVEKVRLCGGVLSQTEIYNLTVTQENNYGTSSKYIEEGIQKWAEALGVTVGQSSVPWPEPKPEPQKEPRSETAATTSVLQGFCGTNCDRQHREHGDGQNAVWSYDGKGTLTISGKGYLADYYDYSIADRPWHEFKDQITNLVVTGEIKSIGFRAFRGCSRLKSVTLPDGLRGIPAYVFEECRALEYISLPNSVEGIGDAAFHNCISLHTVVLPQICFAENAFDPGVILSRSNIALPEREGSCGPNARWKFDGRGKLTVFGTGMMDNLFMFNPWGDFRGKILTVEVGHGITSIGQGAFQNTHVASVLLPEGLKKIETWAFFGCDQLTDISMPASLEEISSLAFRSCSGLHAVRIPQGCQTTPSSFDETTVVSYFAVPGSGVSRETKPTSAKGTCGKNLSWTLDGNGCLTISGTGPMDNYRVPRGIYEPPWAWANTKMRITSIRIGSGVTTIGNWAFYGSGVRSVTLPDSVTAIGERAFLECSELSEFTWNPNIKSIGTCAFQWCSKLNEIRISHDCKLGGHALPSTAKITYFRYKLFGLF